MGKDSDPPGNGTILALIGAELGLGRACAAVLVWVTDIYATHDVDALLAIVTEDVVFLDHRPLGAAPIVGQAAVAEWTRSMFELMPTGRSGSKLAREEIFAHDHEERAAFERLLAVPADS